MAIADAILMEMDMEEKTTQRVLERVPENKLTWKPHPKAYSLGQLAMHIARRAGCVAAAASEDVREFNPPPVPQSRRPARKLWMPSRRAAPTPKKICQKF